MEFTKLRLQNYACFFLLKLPLRVIYNKRGEFERMGHRKNKCFIRCLTLGFVPKKAYLN
jgi:hypothetical protein